MAKIKFFLSLIVCVIFPSVGAAQETSNTVWEGSYKCGSNVTDLTLKLGAFVDGKAPGEFVFNRPSGGFSGSYTISATLGATGTQIIGTPQDWLDRPGNASMVGFQGNVLDGQIVGEIASRRCTTMEVSYVAPWSDAPAPVTTDDVAQTAVLDDSESGAKSEALSDFQALQAELEAMSFDLASLAASNWITLDRNRAAAIYDNSGLPKADIDAVLVPLINQQREAAIPVALAELEAEAIAAQLDLQGHVTFCSNRADDLGGQQRSELKGTIFAMCNQRLADLMQVAGEGQINAVRDDLITRAGTMQDLIDTRGYAFSSEMPRVPRRGPFRDAIEAINAHSDTVEIEIQAARQTAVRNAAQEVRDAFAISGESEENTQLALAMCEPFSNVPSRLAPVAQACREGKQLIQDQRFEADCDAYWEDIDVPEEIRNGLLHTPTPGGVMQPFKIERIICLAAAEWADMKIEADRGLFSTEYRLVHRMEIGNTDVSFSVRLVEPEGIGNITWTVDDPKMEPGGFDLDRVKTSDDLMTCMYRLERCFRAD